MRTVAKYTSKPIYPGSERFLLPISLLLNRIMIFRRDTKTISRFPSFFKIIGKEVPCQCKLLSKVLTLQFVYIKYAIVLLQKTIWFFLVQRSPFAIQELLGLGDSQHRSPTAAVSAITPNVYPPHQRTVPTCFPSDHAAGFNHHHHHMTMAASRMAYFNAQAAVAAAFLPHNIAAAAGMNAAANAGATSPAAVLGLAGHQGGGPAGE